MGSKSQKHIPNADGPDQHKECRTVLSRQLQDHLIMPITFMLALDAICLMWWLNLRLKVNNTPKSHSLLHRFSVKGVSDFLHSMLIMIATLHELSNVIT